MEGAPLRSARENIAGVAGLKSVLSAPFFLLFAGDNLHTLPTAA
jgi:hypothetical protein